MTRVLVAVLGCIALVGSAVPVGANGVLTGHWVVAWSASPNTAVPPAVSPPGPASCANAIQQALAGPGNLQLVQVAETAVPGPEQQQRVYTFTGKGKRTLILVCAKVPPAA